MGKKRTLGLDLGKARVGIAIDDELGMMAHPRPPLDGRDEEALVRAVALLVAEEGVGRIVLGLPMHMSGKEGKGARDTRRIGQKIADATGCEIVLWDERWTTVEAQRALRASEVKARKSKGIIDGAAACAILQGYLDRHGRLS